LHSVIKITVRTETLRLPRHECEQQCMWAKNKVNVQCGEAGIVCSKGGKERMLQVHYKGEPLKCGCKGRNIHAVTVAVAPCFLLFFVFFSLVLIATAPHTWLLHGSYAEAMQLSCSAHSASFASVTTNNILFLSIPFYSMIFLLVPYYSFEVYSSFRLVPNPSTLVLCHAYWNLLALAVPSTCG
jgi:hypothetical protein